MPQAEQPGTNLESHGIRNVARVHWNLSVPALYEQAVNRREALISLEGPLVCRTGQHTGRSPNDKFIVQEASSADRVWWSKVNRPIEARAFDLLHQRMATYVEGRELFVQDCYAGADPDYRLAVRIITEQAWHSLFAKHMFIDVPGAIGAPAHVPEFTVIDMPGLYADPSVHGTNSEVFIVLNFARRTVLIGGTSYAGEIKKSIFTVMNYLLPLRNVLSMHCSANVGPHGDVALFFGLSGTGKTTLSSDPERRLIGDDEHGWSEDGVFNIEGGCYAKMIRLSADAEPQIYATTRRFGTVLENVKMDANTRQLDLADDSLTENTRGAYPLEFIDDWVPSGQGGHPRNIVMLTADAFGVMPPIARLSPAGAMYHFLSGYTAKVAGTEKGVTEPKATFSTCFGAPFMVLHPTVYARFLGEKIARHDVRVWLVNTGWTGGPYGVGSRMKIAYTRRMIRAALSGELDAAPVATDAMFNLDVPQACPGVPPEVFLPRDTWRDPAAYDHQARRLARMFVENFRSFEAEAAPDVKAAGPRGF
ncbi:MAG TPA: phosphoenolpyruvate carboxykinase (ATP) [Vicinamibacterales bacterium]|nr:phosphoenolpyruvate carboxykinase (ATP) [Vicinamibacterales bacterium]